MKENNYLAVRVVCWVVAAYHLVAGVTATLFGESAVTIGSLLYGVGIVMDGQTELLVRYLGAFAISFGVLMVSFGSPSSPVSGSRLRMEIVSELW